MCIGTTVWRGDGRRAAGPVGFTLVELLVVIGVIGLLIGLLLPALSRARGASRQVKSQSDLRQMLVGYALYHQDNRGSLLLGYPPPEMVGGAAVYDPRLGRTYTGPFANLSVSRYPWRLLPYVGNIWQIIHGHDEMPALPEAGDDNATAAQKAYALSLWPTFGLNSAYLGGDTGAAGFVQVGGAWRANARRHVAFKASEVRRSSQLIVFAHARVRNQPGSEGRGMFRATPPRMGGVMWRVEGRRIVATPGVSMGVPEGWFTSRAVVGFFDGHVEARLPEELEDMRLWASRATGADDDYVP